MNDTENKVNHCDSAYLDVLPTCTTDGENYEYANDTNCEGSSSVQNNDSDKSYHPSDDDNFGHDIGGKIIIKWCFTKIYCLSNAY